MMVHVTCPPGVFADQQINIQARPPAPAPPPSLPPSIPPAEACVGRAERGGRGQAPGGGLLVVAVPAGVGPGGIFHVQVPAAGVVQQQQEVQIIEQQPQVPPPPPPHEAWCLSPCGRPDPPPLQACSLPPAPPRPGAHRPGPEGEAGDGAGAGARGAPPAALQRRDGDGGAGRGLMMGAMLGGGMDGGFDFD
jgi:hypothetical protein